MKATLAILTDRETSNATSRLAWDMFQQFGVGIGARRLPPHVSLKQPFECDDLPALAQFAGRFAASIAPFAVELSDCVLWESPTDAPVSGVLSVQVREAATPRELHNRLNRELASAFGVRPADFDGDAYRFHLTISAGGASVEAYREALAYTESVWMPRRFTARELALFVYDQDANGEWQYLTYAITALADKGESEDERFMGAV